MTTVKSITIRPSSLSTFNDCQRRAIAQTLPDLVDEGGYDLRPPPASHVGAIVGSGVHAGISHSLTQKQQTGSIGSEKDADECAIQELRQRAERDGCRWDAITKNTNTAEKQVLRMGSTWRQQLAPQITPVLVETRLEVEAAPGIILSGQLDALAQEMDAIRDTKTGSTQRSHGAQYGAYSMLFRGHGHTVSHLYEDFVQRVDIRKPQPDVETIAIPIDVAEHEAYATIQRLIGTIDEYRRRLRGESDGPPNMAFAANPNSMLCSRKFCRAWGTKWCQAHKPETDDDA